jgi:hypothetical protein
VPDAAMMATATTVVCLSALVAIWVPAREALRIDPIATLKVV